MDEVDLKQIVYDHLQGDQIVRNIQTVGKLYGGPGTADDPELHHKMSLVAVLPPGTEWDNEALRKRYDDEGWTELSDMDVWLISAAAKGVLREAALDPAEFTGRAKKG